MSAHVSDTQDAPSILDARAMSALANADAPNKAELARAFGDLVATCVACHSVFLDEEPPKTVLRTER